ncbi:uncharacterized protein PFLUO_LOCUS1250 [Penicillium psychrofluorescens]|uniref:uncharacterized protein n=1 Tax=Penicillium psychrofluorescens TaxID=3158075 RepID=UPI003CCD7BFF
MKAFCVTAAKVAGVVERTLPKLRDDYILVRVISVALNPTDWKHIDFLAKPGQLVGCDYAGIVEEVGKDVQKDFVKGDRVFGLVHGCNDLQEEDGAFAEYVVDKGDTQWRIPNNISFQQAATLGVGVSTVIQALYQLLDLKWPKNGLSSTDNEGDILIYGGSTATGYLAIQFANLSGYRVIATCSPHNFDLVRDAGADAVFDYRDPGSAAEIRKYTQNSLKFAFDCVATPDSANFCDNAMSSEGGHKASINGGRAIALMSTHASIDPATMKEGNITTSFPLAYTTTGEDLNKAGKFIAARSQDKAYIIAFSSLLEDLLAEGKFKAIRHTVRGQGLHGIAEGLALMREGKVTGEKLVYNIADAA